MRRVFDAAVTLLVGGTVAVPAAALIHDLLPAHPPAAASWVLLVGLLVGASLTLGPSVARRVAASGRWRAIGVLVGAAAATAWIASPPLELLGADVPTAATLAWTLGEEDNAQIIRIAREAIMDGPGGGELDDQFGTGFVVVATTVGRMLATGQDGDDPRVLAIEAFTTSVVAAIVLLGLGMAVAALLGPAPALRLRTRVAGVVGAALTALTVALAVAAALGVAVVLPMRTGFLSFVWAFVWAALGVALMPLALDRESRAATGVVVLHVVVTALLLIRAWPFLVAAFMPAAVLVLRRIPWSSLGRFVRRRPLPAVGAMLVLLLVAGLVSTRVLARGALGEVLSYGREAFTAVASGISFDGRIVMAVLGAATLIVARAVTHFRESRLERTLVLVGPAAGVLGSWLVLRGIAEIVAGGEFNYAGTKLLYGVVVVAAVTLLPMAAAGWGGRRPTTSVAGLAALAAILLLAASSPTVRTVDDWAARLAPSEPAHALAVIEAIDRTTPELPVRCRPSRGTAVTPTSRWAAYFCVRWVEDALNVDRQQAFRDDFLQAPDGTFDDLVAEATAEGIYGFAYVMDLGPGWFGWDGRS